MPTATLNGHQKLADATAAEVTNVESAAGINLLPTITHVAATDTSPESWGFTEGTERRDYPTEATATEAAHQVACYRATRFLLKVLLGGKKYAAEGLAGRLARACAEAGLADVKEKLRTADKIVDAVTAVDEEGIREILAAFKNIGDATAILASKYQSPMVGGKIPRQVLTHFATALYPVKGAAQREEGLQGMSAAIGVK